MNIYKAILNLTKVGEKFILKIEVERDGEKGSSEYLIADNRIAWILPDKAEQLQEWCRFNNQSPTPKVSDYPGAHGERLD